MRLSLTSDTTLTRQLQARAGWGATTRSDAYALSGGAAVGAGGVPVGVVALLAALDDAELAARLSQDVGSDVGGEAVALQQSLSDRLHPQPRT